MSIEQIATTVTEEQSELNVNERLAHFRTGLQQLQDTYKIVIVLTDRIGNAMLTSQQVIFAPIEEIQQGQSE